jgi:hypothetical protein
MKLRIDKTNNQIRINNFDVGSVERVNKAIKAKKSLYKKGLRISP